MPATTRPESFSAINRTTSYARKIENPDYIELPFSPTITFNRTPGYLAWAMADFDGDGRNEIITVHVNWTPVGDEVEYYRLQDGKYVKDPAVFDGDVPRVVHGRKAIVADFNNDGKPDVVIAGHGFDTRPFRGELPLLLMNTGGKFKRQPLPVKPAFYHSGCAGDVNNDGHTDLVFTDHAQACPVLINDGAGNFKAEPGAFPLKGKGYYTSELFDVDGDGNLDLVVGGHEMDGGETRIFWGDGSGHFTLERSTLLPPIYGWRIVIGVDFIQGPDGTIDVLLNRTGDYKGPIGWYHGYYLQLLKNVGGRKFADATAVSLDSPFERSGNWITWLRPHDVNGDGHIDITSENKADRLEWIQKDGRFTKVAP